MDKFHDVKISGKKKSYESPRLAVYGDLRKVTAGSKPGTSGDVGRTKGA